MTNEAPLPEPTPLDRSHDLASFNCGESALNDYLLKFAWQSHQGHAGRTYVATRGLQVVGYYTLAAGSIQAEDAPSRLAKGLGRHPSPIILLARLAVDQSEQGKGLGASLLKDALLRASRAAEIVGCRAVVAQAKNESARNFYIKFGFEPSPIDDYRVFLLMKDIKAILGSKR